MATKKPLVQLTAWSYSRFADYDTCPLKCKLKHIDHLKEPSNAAMDRGNIVHKLAEQFVTGQLRAYPVKELGKAFKESIANLRKIKAICEQEWAFTKQYVMTSWFAKDAWLRIKMDAHYLELQKVRKLTETKIVTVDYKTGREHQEHALQRSLYAVGALQVYPDAQSVHVEHWYLDSGAVGADDFKRSQLPMLLKQWEQRTRAMLNDHRFAPRAGQHCRWCHWRKSNGGPCVY